MAPRRRAISASLPGSTAMAPRSGPRWRRGKTNKHRHCEEPEATWQSRGRVNRSGLLRFARNDEEVLHCGGPALASSPNKRGKQMTPNILAPGAVLILWTLIMLVWVAVSRFRALAKSGIDLKAAPPGGRGGDLEGILPPLANWKSHNYTHLLEQPTLFYAVILILHAVGGYPAYVVWIAWTYVALRVIHSFWQATVNRIPVRFAIFAASTLCLLALALLAVIA